MYSWLGYSDVWFDSGCGSGPRVRWHPDGSIEIENEGIPRKPLSDTVSKWVSLITYSASKYNVPPQWIAAHIAAESGGNEKAHSACCYGLLGLLPATASSMAGRSVGASELMADPALNIELGTKLLGQLFSKYSSNPLKIAASYNTGAPKCGSGKCNAPNRWNLIADCVGGVAFDYETQVISFSNSALGMLKTTPKSSSNAKIIIGLLALGTVGIIVSRYTRVPLIRKV